MCKLSRAHAMRRTLKKHDRVVNCPDVKGKHSFLFPCLFFTIDMVVFPLSLSCVGLHWTGWNSAVRILLIKKTKKNKTNPELTSYSYYPTLYSTYSTIICHVYPYYTLNDFTFLP